MNKPVTVKVEYKAKAPVKEIKLGDYFDTECGVRQLSKVGTMIDGERVTIYFTLCPEGRVTNHNDSIESVLSLYDYVKPLEVVSHELKLREI